MVFEINLKLLMILSILTLAQAYGPDEPTSKKSLLPSATGAIINNLTPQNFDITKCLQKSNSLLCNDAENYPWKNIQKILSLKKLPLEFFGNDSIPSSDNDFDDDAKNHEPANKDAGADHDPLDKDGENHERGFCESKEELKFPKIALNKNLELRYIIQGDTSSFKRGILTESCVPNAQCMYSSNLPPEISVRCVEKYLYKKLIALDPSTGDAYVDDFPIPSCCVCMYRELKDEYASK